ncbi:uncharacterized protein BO72DRAFT_451196 [Aspergillus fijiensis CBS 313.89]|uniref:Uncharacterized protein n=1 Tax=Aspergillus fijiensis CBS 313.89 TaxID=1448319 RepID=A0A8G1VV87_9EURO|nr:uncharacterized protein BO72DRAFT_451196 [Aspergillus fijiensis CBS 313.89]RAK73877.1 hypothetical protein BO72DRAFT_451196 [Aspergillus fijiensis CBS 313.89]
MGEKRKKRSLLRSFLSLSFFLFSCPVALLFAPPLPLPTKLSLLPYPTQFPFTHPPH